MSVPSVSLLFPSSLPSTRAAPPVSCCFLAAASSPFCIGECLGWRMGHFLIGWCLNFGQHAGTTLDIPRISGHQELYHSRQSVNSCSCCMKAVQCTYTHHLDKVLEEAAATFHPHVECPKYPGFCLTRQKNEYPFIEVFYNPEQAASPGKAVDPNVTKYSVKVLPFNYDQSVYGFREYFKKHGFKYFETN
uniref:Uncharacterized protein n=1 Tax=Oryza rufipogon TaxID=4529 RepID=A0A0E0QWJ5_ORYRU